MVVAIEWGNGWKRVGGRGILIEWNGVYMFTNTRKMLYTTTSFFFTFQLLLLLLLLHFHNIHLWYYTSREEKRKFVVVVYFSVVVYFFWIIFKTHTHTRTKIRRRSRTHILFRKYDILLKRVVQSQFPFYTLVFFLQIRIFSMKS